MRLIVGLGNPGTRYAKTRHNAGFLAIDAWAARQEQRVDHPWGGTRQPLGMIAQFDWSQGETTDPVVVLKPTTMMNASGMAVTAALEQWQVDSTDCLVVCDDLHLPLGQLRFRTQGTAGGHHGLESIIGAIASEDFPRLRIGIGVPPPEQDTSAFVVGQFTSSEWSVMDPAITRATDALTSWLVQGSEVTMNLFNRRISEGD
jgi:peptidyl-tRNA hydrolase, PTH1 family